jgi:hypothetical protein
MIERIVAAFVPLVDCAGSRSLAPPPPSFDRVELSPRNVAAAQFEVHTPFASAHSLVSRVAAPLCTARMPR